MNSNNEYEVGCLLCGQGLRPVGEDFTGKEIFKCDRCDYVTTPIAITSETTALYDDPEYFDGWGCNLEFDYDRFEPAVHQQVHDYLEFINEHARGVSLLDVGTGSGLLPFLGQTTG